MRKLRIYQPELAPNADTTITLSEAAQHRLFTVLRVEADTEIELFDGQGHWQRAVIVPNTASPGANAKRSRKPKKNALSARTTMAPCLSDRTPLQVHYGIALIKGERFDWALQKMTELGVTEITPLICEHGEVKLSGERLTKKRLQWQAILIAAAEQCHLNWLPIINAPQPMDVWCTHTIEHVDKAWIMSPADSANEAHCATNPTPAGLAPKRLAICSGPEGGFSEAEIAVARKIGFNPITLGPRVLRAETAPIVALGLSHWLWGDFRVEQAATYPSVKEQVGHTTL